MEKSMRLCHMCLRAQTASFIVNFFHYFPFFYSINDKIRIILWFFYQLAVNAYARVDQTDTKPAKCLRLFDAEKCLSPCQRFLISATINKTQQWRTIASEQENRRSKYCVRAYKTRTFSIDYNLYEIPHQLSKSISIHFHNCRMSISTSMPHTISRVFPHSMCQPAKIQAHFIVNTL